jgi:hypothetical protein
MIDAVVNPELYGVSLGFRILNINALKRKISTVINNHGHGIGWHGTNGELKQVVPAAAVSSSSSSSKRTKKGPLDNKVVNRLVGTFVSETIKSVNGAKSNHDVAVAKDYVMAVANHNKTVTAERIQKSLITKEAKQVKKNNKMINLKQNKNKK